MLDSRRTAMHTSICPPPQNVNSLANTLGQAAFKPGTATPGHPSAQDGAFIAMLDAYRPYGGLSRLHGLTAGGRIRSEGRESVVGDLVAEGGLFGFHWHDDVWIPMFQFNMPGPTVASGPQRVVAELGCGFDGWALANWFVQPHEWLACDSPIECLGSRLDAVLEAARADHFAAMG
jgi:hypothetical protein